MARKGTPEATSTAQSKDYKVCKKCYAHTSPEADACTSCGHKKFAPPFVLEYRKISGNSALNVFKPFEDKPHSHKVINLNKYWPGGRGSFNVVSPAMWARVKHLIDNDLAPLIGWETVETADATIEAAKPHVKLSELATQYPEKFGDLLEAVKAAMDAPTGEEGAQLFASIADLITHFDSITQRRIRNAIENLKKQDSGSIERLNELLTELSLSQVTAVVREIERRLQTITFFEERLKDEKTYEIRGPNSIHSILQRDLWLLDENYWLIHSNETLKTFIGDKMAEEDKKHEKKRPDFVCGTLGDKLVLAELKRPAHKLTAEDLNQLERYMVLSEQYSDFKSFDAVLLGSSITPEVRSILKHRRGVRVLSYWEVLSKARKRYEEFIKNKHEDLKDSESGIMSGEATAVPARRQRGAAPSRTPGRRAAPRK